MFWFFKKQHKSEDKEIIKSILEGNVEEYSFIVDKYQDKLFRYIKNMYYFLEEEEIDNILQEVFIKVYRKLNSYNEQYEFSTWLYKITRNHTINSIRDDKKNRDNIISINEINLDNDEGVLDFFENIEDKKNNIEKNLKLKEKYILLYETLDTLKPEYKEVLILKFIEWKNYSEISDILSIPEWTVATYINRAKWQFKKNIARENLNLEDYF